MATIKESGTLRHLGIPYANFVTGSGDGMDVELMRLFAQYLGVRYQYVPTSWGESIGDLTGRKVRSNGNEFTVVAEVPIKGDVIASGMTILPWRKHVVAFADPTFPTQVWLLARADSDIRPIVPSNNLATDIVTTKAVLPNRTLLGKLETCLDPNLYAIDKTGAKVSLFQGTLNELTPAILNGESELTLLDVPDALVALQKWPGEIKVIGPISEVQYMAPAFRQDDPMLREAFRAFITELRFDGRFRRITLKYYPFIDDFFPGFLAGPPR